MEFNEKLQMLRKNAQLTQEQLAEKIHISRTAVSKWESGRGFPNIQALQNLSKVFDVPVDSLLSSDEILDLAKKDTILQVSKMISLIFGLLDIVQIMFIFLPLYGQQDGAFVRMVNLLEKKDISYIRTIYLLSFSLLITCGITGIIIRFSNRIRLHRLARLGSFALHILVVIFSIMNREPYVNFLLFFLLIMKAIIFLGNTEYSKKL
jgi:transcriptional regulator with XRE-family HTH domain